MAEVKHVLNGNNLVISISGRMDTTTSVEIEESINSITNSNSFEKLSLDIEKLDYISSAGLRVVLRVKKAYDNFEVINASNEVYDIFEMTGFSEIISVKRALRKLSVDGLEVVGKGAKGIVYRYNEDTIVKVYFDPNSIEKIEKEKKLAQKALILGVPTAISYDIVRVNDTYGSVFELLESKTLTNSIKDDLSNLNKYAHVFSEILKSMHTVEDVKDETPDAKLLVYKWLEDTKGLFTNEDYSKLKSLVDNVPNSNDLLHIDFHPNNILMQSGEAILIDMDTLSHGNPIFDFANIYAPLVGFKYIDANIIGEFFEINPEVMFEFYDLFIQEYFGKNDKDIENKIQLLGLLRVIRHLERRKDKYSNYEKAKDTLLSMIHNLLQLVNDISL